MSFPVLPHGFLGAQGDSDTYRIERSLRFNSADSAYLNRTPASAGNRKTWTWSGWVKRGLINGNFRTLFGVNNGSGSSYFALNITTSETLACSDNATYYRFTTQVFRDPSAWYHVVCAVDTTLATGSDRIKFYVNGSQITSFSTSSDPSQNSDLGINQAAEHGIGRIATDLRYFDGYLTEINFIDGQALTPSSFGETDAITGRWKAKAYSGTYGTNGFYLKFADNSGTTATTLGKDSSGNGNNWTPNNFSVTAGAGNDSLVDSPTNYGTDTGLGGEVRGNYATWNPLRPSGYVFSNGNLDVVGSGANNQNYPLSNFTASSGKWYFEITSVSLGTDPFVGISDIAKKYSIIYAKAGTISKGDVISYTTLSTKSSFTGGDIIGIAVNADASTVAFYKNNVLQDTINFSTASMVNTDWYAICSSSSNPTTSWTINFGQRPFAYTAPSGFKALCTTNLPTPTIKKSSNAMDALTFTATGSVQSITGLNFSPKFVWIKNRATWAGNRHTLYDIIRGGQQRLDSSTTEAEAADNDLISFDSNGFSSDLSGTTYVAWAWDAGSTTSTNNSGTITSTVRANPQAGFSIVSYTGTGANATVGHGLGVAPKMVIWKNRSASTNWIVWHSSLGANALNLNTTSSQFSQGNFFPGLPYSVAFNVGTDSATNGSGNSHIAYCFAEIEGYSKFGSYTGNGSSDGPFVWCGFRPRWVMWKVTSTTEHWTVFDTARDTFNFSRFRLHPSGSFSESTGTESAGEIAMDILANGFKLRNTSTNINGSNQTYIFAAFAEAPFKYARAR